MKTYIKGFKLRGFKSFNNKRELSFGPGMNCIIGANGSGKSNCLDGMCFVLGRLSTKSLRADNYSELLFRRKGQNAKSEAYISLVFDNKTGIFPVKDKEIELLRKIKKSGQTQYKLNGKNATRQQVVEFLSHAKIHSDGHSIILQGDIHKFVEMRPIEKRGVIEEVAGISVYEDRKNRAMKELEKVESRLKEVQIVLKEKEGYLKGLEDEKRDAERYRSLKSELVNVQATEVKLKIDFVNAQKAKLGNELKTLNEDLEKLEKGVSGKKNEIKTFRDDISKLEKEIEKKGGEEQLELQREIETLKVHIENNKGLIETSKNEIKKVAERKKQLDDSVNELEDKIKDNKKERTQLEKARAELSKREGSLRGKKGFSDLDKLNKEIDNIDSGLDKLDDERDSLNKELSDYTSELKVLDSEIGSLRERVSESSKLGKKYDKGVNKQRYKTLLSEISKAAAEDSKLAIKIGDFKKRLNKKEEEFAKANIRASSARELLARDVAVKTILNKGIKGVLGTVADLGEVDNKFSGALQVAAGNRMRNVVVDKADTGIRCLKMLKENRAGVATFLPLDKLRVHNIPNCPKGKGIAGYAFELVDCDAKYKNLFKYVFGNTIVVEDVNTAKELGISKYRMVTLQGDVFERSGAITGGYRRKNVGVGFKEAKVNDKLDEMMVVITSLKKEIDQSENKRNALEEKISLLRKEKAELEGMLEVGGAIDTSGLEKQIGSKEKRKKELEKDIDGLDKDVSKLDKEIDGLDSKRKGLMERLKKARVAIQSKEMEDLLKEQSALDSKLASIQAIIDNALLPEKENTLRVLKGLDKEKKEFDDQIKDLKNKIKEQTASLASKEEEEKKAYGKLKALFSKKSKLSDNIKVSEEELDSLREASGKKELERNDYSVRAAKLDGEFASFKEELKQFGDAKMLDYVKSVSGAKKMIRNLNHKLAELGNVNMKALEVYEELKKDYDSLVWKVSKLTSEQNDILSVVDEIEKRKTSEFMKTFKEVAKHFAELYNKVNDKNTAKLALMNEKNPFEDGVAVRIIDNKGKRVSAASLSGGEKVLVALAFIFAIQEHDPAPVYLLDEIDAALDKVNSEKVAKLLRDYSKKAQVVIISHNDAIVSEADYIYGVSMNKNGESNIVSMKL
jgi:chromosome segregation protein